jgi:hypothetical protein
MPDLKAYLVELHQNLNTLREREAKHAGRAPLDLLNQIDDHQAAIELTEQALRGELSQAEWREALKPLLVSLNIFGDFFAPPPPLQLSPRAEHFTAREVGDRRDEGRERAPQQRDNRPGVALWAGRSSHYDDQKDCQARGLWGSPG